MSSFTTRSEDRASGVRVLDAETGAQTEYFARVIFLCASTFGSTFILLNSISDRFPNGFGNDSGELGCNIMDHHLDVGAVRWLTDSKIATTAGGDPTGSTFRVIAISARTSATTCAVLATRVVRRRSDWPSLLRDDALGAELKEKATKPGPWHISLGGFGEILPYHENRVTLDHSSQGQVWPAAARVRCGTEAERVPHAQGYGE